MKIHNFWDEVKVGDRLRWNGLAHSGHSGIYTCTVKFVGSRYYIADDENGKEIMGHIPAVGNSWLEVWRD